MTPEVDMSVHAQMNRTREMLDRFAAGQGRKHRGQLEEPEGPATVFAAKPATATTAKRVNTRRKR